MSRDTISIGDKFSFESYGVLELVKMEYDLDSYVFSDRTGGTMSFRKEELTEKVYDVTNHVGDRVSEMNHGTGRITQIKDTLTHWPYHIEFDDGYSAWYGADNFEVVNPLSQQKSMALATAEREIAFHEKKLAEWQAIRDALVDSGS